MKEAEDRLAWIKASLSGERHCNMFSAQLSLASENLHTETVSRSNVRAEFGSEPGWIGGWQGIIFDDMTALVADYVGLIPDSTPKFINMGDRPGIQIMVRLQGQA